MDPELEKELEKLKDVEVGYKRSLGRRAALIMAGVGFLMSVFHIYVLLIRAIDPWIFRSIHIVFGGALLFPLSPDGRTRRGTVSTSSITCSSPASAPPLAISSGTSRASS